MRPISRRVGPTSLARALDAIRAVYLFRQREALSGRQSANLDRHLNDNAARAVEIAERSAGDKELRKIWLEHLQDHDIKTNGAVPSPRNWLIGRLSILYKKYGFEDVRGVTNRLKIFLTCCMNYIELGELELTDRNIHDVVRRAKRLQPKSR